MGTGLGLSMIYGFAKQSGGQVRIYSEVGKGTSVSIYLPRHDVQEEAASAPAEVPLAPRADQGDTVLVLDDEPALRMIIVEVMQGLGYATLEAGDGAEALRILQSPRQRIDLLVSDVGLPGGMNGRQVADAARIERPGLKVLFITGYAENAVLSHGHLDPGMHVMTKPFEMDVLARRVKQLIESR
jgi:CheY-like chemotaxis protein